MDDILASIRKIIAEEPLSSRPVPGALHDGPPGSQNPAQPRNEARRALGPQRPFAEATPPHPPKTLDDDMLLDDDLFEPLDAEPQYVSPRPPRDLIFTPTPFPNEEASRNEQVVPEVLEPSSQALRPDVNVANAVDYTDSVSTLSPLDAEVDEIVHDEIVIESAPENASLPSLDEIAAALALTKPNRPIAIDESGTMPAAAPEASALAGQTEVAAGAPIELNALDRSVEDLLGALAAGLAQQVPAVEAPSVEPDEVTEEQARTAVAEAIAAITTANTAAPVEVNEVAAAEAHLADALVGEATEEPEVAVTGVAEAPVEPVAVVTTKAESEGRAERGVETAVSIAEPLEQTLMPVAEDIVAPLVPGMTAAALAASALPNNPAPVVEPAKADAAPNDPMAKTFEDTVTAMLRPLIKDWLDRHMPDMVAKALEAELKSRFNPSDLS